MYGGALVGVRGCWRWCSQQWSASLEAVEAPLATGLVHWHLVPDTQTLTGGKCSLLNIGIAQCTVSGGTGTWFTSPTPHRTPHYSHHLSQQHLAQMHWHGTVFSSQTHLRVQKHLYTYVPPFPPSASHPENHTYFHEFILSAMAASSL